jgi:hypothetical protein
MLDHEAAHSCGRVIEHIRSWATPTRPWIASFRTLRTCESKASSLSDPVDYGDPTGLKESVSELGEHDVEKCVKVGAASGAVGLAFGAGTGAAAAGGCAVGAGLTTARDWYEEIAEEEGEFIETGGELLHTAEDVIDSL